jgi:IS5 family transposase
MPGKIAYRVKNWSEYNRSLINRGNITIWFSDDAIEGWKSSKRGEGRGRPEEFSDEAVECCLLLRSLYHLPLRAAQGFVEGMMSLLQLPLEAPHYTLLCKRAGKLSIDLKSLRTSKPLNVVIDSTGLKVYGEGEWKMRCHGKSKRRTWRKLHLGVDPTTHEIVGCELTDQKTHDCEVIDDVLPDQNLGKVCADGAYDNEPSYEAIVKRNGEPLIPPRSGACKTKSPSRAMARRNHTVQACWSIGRDNWKKGSGYHQRSLAETAMFRFKTIFGGKIASRKFDNQKAEVRLKSQILNRMRECGMPKSYKIQ